MAGVESQSDCAADGLRCGWDPALDLYNCVETQAADPSGAHPLWCPGTCEPDCTNKDCGDDGCGSSTACGSCVPGFVCGEDFTCILETADDDVRTAEETGGGGSGGGGERSPGACAAAPVSDPAPLPLLLVALGLLAVLRRQAPLSQPQVVPRHCPEANHAEASTGHRRR